MPLYEYECVKDGRFELIRKFSDPPVETCFSCGGPVRKLISSSAIQFKGSGWYITDYARKGQTQKSEGASSDSGSKSDSDSKKDAKPATDSKTTKTTE